MGTKKAKATDEVDEAVGDVPEEFKKTDDAGRPTVGAVLDGDAEAEPVVVSHKTK